MTSNIKRIQRIETHQLSDGNWATITKLGKTYNFNLYGGKIEVPESVIGITKFTAYQLLIRALKSDVLEN